MVEGQWCSNLGAEITPSEIDHHIKCDQMKKDMIKGWSVINNPVCNSRELVV